MKVRYPVEAYALAMVIFSQNMQDALLTGILILLITTLGLVIDRLVGNKLPKWSRNACVLVLMISITYSLFQIASIAILGWDIDNSTSLFHLFLGMLIGKHIIDAEGESDYNRLLLEGAGAFATLLIISIIREFMAEGSIYGFEIADFDFMSNGFSNIIIGFMLAGLGIAILNKIFAYKKYKAESLFVIIPVVLLAQPFTIDSIESSISMIITIAIVLIFVYSVRKHLVFSRLSKEIKYLPAELVSTGMIYMILSMF